jgi:taurine dioxygenase
MAISVTPTGSGIGADVTGIDLGKISDTDAKAIHAAWIAHQVLRFRGQKLDDDALARFSAYFGELEKAPIGFKGRAYMTERPEVTVISNIKIDGQSIGGLGDGEAEWHSDMTYIDMPPDASALYCIECPPSGGNTWFMNMYDAYDRLPTGLKSRLADLTCKHDATRSSDGRLRAGFEETYTREELPGAIHPLVIQHPESGKTALYLGRRRNAHILQLSPAESDSLLDELWAHVRENASVWTQQWQVGDLVMWDNRCTMHRRDSFDPASRRLMHRTQMKGSAKPVAAMVAA